MAFQENLKYYREQKGYTAKELSELIDIPYSTYLNYEKINQGRRTEPRYDTLCKIAHILQVSTDELLGFETSTIYNCLRIIQKSGGTIEKYGKDGTPLPLEAMEYDHIRIVFTDFNEVTAIIPKAKIVNTISTAYNAYLQDTKKTLQLEIIVHSESIISDKPLAFFK